MGWLQAHLRKEAVSVLSIGSEVKYDNFSAVSFKYSWTSFSLWFENILWLIGFKNGLKTWVKVYIYLIWLIIKLF